MVVGGGGINETTDEAGKLVLLRNSQIDELIVDEISN